MEDSHVETFWLVLYPGGFYDLHVKESPSVYFGVVDVREGVYYDPHRFGAFGWVCLEPQASFRKGVLHWFVMSLQRL